MHSSLCSPWITSLLFLFLQVQLCFMNGNHYDSVYPISHVRNAGMCQCECLRLNTSMYTETLIYTPKRWRSEQYFRHITSFQNESILCLVLMLYSVSVYCLAFHVNWDQICLFCVFHPAAILYELLYDRVFKVDQGLLGLCQRVPRLTDVLSDDSMPFCGSSEESDLDTSEALW